MKVAEDTVSLTGAGGGGMGKWQQQLRVDSCGTNTEWEKERGRASEPQTSASASQLSLRFCRCLWYLWYLCQVQAAIWPPSPSLTPFDWRCHHVQQMNLTFPMSRRVPLSWCELMLMSETGRKWGRSRSEGGGVGGGEAGVWFTIVVQSQRFRLTYFAAAASKGTCLRPPMHSLSRSLPSYLTPSTDFLFKFA